MYPHIQQSISQSQGEGSCAHTYNRVSLCHREREMLSLAGKRMEEEDIIVKSATDRRTVCCFCLMDGNTLIKDDPNMEEGLSATAKA